MPSVRWRSSNANVGRRVWKQQVRTTILEVYALKWASTKRRSDMSNYKEAIQRGEGVLRARNENQESDTFGKPYLSSGVQNQPGRLVAGNVGEGGAQKWPPPVQRDAIVKVVVARLQTIGGWRRCGPFSGLCWMGRWIPGRPNRCSCCRTRSRRRPWPRKTTASSPRSLSVFSLQ